ncbi:hypothetical protein [Natrinema sp. 1APR25-10V2]|uniref:hypothetical protein n=1 Tax=Natrinema sp. 1APR25-10V2 TaxID=2951081 RepID=UPI00287663BB|nr:hypothetical protein [Natrinema sp. 1APR25-10V2]MDS0476822.1 hypothetical protein [Natrinema sp. 1APR25-10V2]
MVVDQEQPLEIWIRPERVGYGYTVEWTPVTFDAEEQEWHPAMSKRDESYRTTARQLLNDLTGNIRRKMPTFDVDREPLYVFLVGDRYLFKAYFDEDNMFDALRPYYNEDDYRFEVPQDAFNDVKEVLEDHFYEPVVVRDLEPFCVVYPKYTEHPTVLFKAAVLQRSRSDKHIFLMKDQRSVEQAVNRGAIPLTESDIDGPRF